MRNTLKPPRISQHDLAPHIGQRDQSWFIRHGEDVGGFVTCTLLSVCFVFLATIFAIPAFEADIGLFGRGALLLVAGFFSVGAVVFANYVIKAARWFIKNRRLAKRHA